MDKRPQNPIREVREQRGMSLDRFSTMLGINLQAVYLNECGVYPHILPVIRKWMEQEGYDVRSFDEQYFLFQEHTRIQNGTVYGAGDIAPPEPGDEHPFTAFREELGVSRMGFSKDMCIHPAFLYKLERGEAHGLSSQCKSAMLDAGFTMALVNELDARCREYAANSSSERTAS